MTELEEYDYTVKYLPGILNVKADPFSRNRAAVTNYTSSMLDDKIYAVLDSGSFLEQLRIEQNNDSIIRQASEILTKGELIKEGRLKRVQKQLRVENEHFRISDALVFNFRFFVNFLSYFRISKITSIIKFFDKLLKVSQK